LPIGAFLLETSSPPLLPWLVNKTFSLSLRPFRFLALRVCLFGRTGTFFPLYSFLFRLLTFILPLFFVAFPVGNGFSSEKGTFVIPLRFSSSPLHGHAISRPCYGPRLGDIPDLKEDFFPLEGSQYLIPFAFRWPLFFFVLVSNIGGFISVAFPSPREPSFSSSICPSLIRERLSLFLDAQGRFVSNQAFSSLIRAGFLSPHTNYFF